MLHEATALTQDGRGQKCQGVFFKVIFQQIKTWIDEFALNIKNYIK